MKYGLTCIFLFFIIFNIFPENKSLYEMEVYINPITSFFVPHEDEADVAGSPLRSGIKNKFQYKFFKFQNFSADFRSGFDIVYFNKDYMGDSDEFNFTQPYLGFGANLVDGFGYSLDVYMHFGFNQYNSLDPKLSLMQTCYLKHDFGAVELDFSLSYLDVPDEKNFPDENFSFHAQDLYFVKTKIIVYFLKTLGITIGYDLIGRDESFWEDPDTFTYTTVIEDGALNSLIYGIKYKPSNNFKIYIEIYDPIWGTNEPNGLKYVFGLQRFF